MPYLTGDNVAEYTCVVVRVPTDSNFESAFFGALLQLTHAHNWEQQGTATPEQAAELWRDYFYAIEDRDCEATEMTVPLGAVIPYAGASIPDGFHEMDGTFLLASEYPELWAVIDSGFKGTLGGEDAVHLKSMTFRAPIGYSSVGEYWSMGGTGGEVEHTLSVLEMPEHSHEYLTGYPAYNQPRAARGADYAPQGNLSTESVGGGEPHNNMPPYMCFRYMMRVE